MSVLDRLIPAPKQAQLLGGTVELGRNPQIHIPAGAGAGVERIAGLLGEEILERFGLSARIDVMPADAECGISISIDGALAGIPVDSPVPEEAYRMECRNGLVSISGASESGLRNGIWSLLALSSKTGSVMQVPRVSLHDWPSLKYRWFMEDLSRGKVPTLASLKQMARLLAGWKFNGFQLYIEHTFRFNKHPRIGGGWSPVSPDEVKELDAYCRRLGLELVPSLASFGHMERIFEVKKYRRLSVGEPWRLLMPMEENSYRFLDELYSEYLPCFSSRFFNVNCDETYDLGRGRSAGLVRQFGKGGVYLRHILRLYGLVTKKYGKRLMMWGDIIGHHPRIIPRLPKDVVVQPWGYFNTWSPKDMQPYVRSGLEFLVCPGSSAWHSLSPWTHVSSRNIKSAARSSSRAGGLGVMTTDWGDGGHQQPLGLSWYAMANAAEQGWSGGQTTGSNIDRRFSATVFGDSSGRAAELWRLLGEANNSLRISPVYVFWWYTVNFGLLFYEHDLQGKLFKRVKPAGVARLRKTANRASTILASLNRIKAGPELLRQELGYSVHLLSHLADRLDWMLALKRGSRGPAIRRQGTLLQGQLGRLRVEFLRMWNARNRPHKREMTLKYFDKAASFYRSLMGKI